MRHLEITDGNNVSYKSANGQMVIIEAKRQGKLNRYLLFMSYVNDSAGGWGDFVGSFDSVQEAERYAESNKYVGNWWHEIIDGTTGKQIVHVVSQ